MAIKPSVVWKPTLTDCGRRGRVYNRDGGYKAAVVIVGHQYAIGRIDRGRGRILILVPRDAVGEDRVGDDAGVGMEFSPTLRQGRGRARRMQKHRGAAD